MPALFRIVADDHPPLPEGVSPLVRDFLMQCFQKDANLRVDAKKLLKHPWIVSAKKAETKKPTEYDETVKSVQEWNKALKASPPNGHAGNGVSRRSSTKAVSRPDSRSAPKAPVGRHQTPTPGSKPPSRLAARSAQNYQSAEDEDGDNWDNDFESLSSSLAALQLPDHLRPQDHFAGLMSSEKLKQYASFDSIPEMDGKVEEWDGEFEGALTVRSPMQLSKGNAIETVRPFYPSRTTSYEIKHQPPSGTAKTTVQKAAPVRKASKDSQPRTQILRPGVEKAVGAVQPKPAPAALAKTSPLPGLGSQDKYREHDEEDYSDLVPKDDTAFRKRLASFSPSKPFKPNDLRKIQQNLGGSVRRRTRTPTNLVHDAAAIRRSRSSLEIQKYAEVEEDDFTDCFADGDGTLMNLNPTKTRSPKSSFSRKRLLQQF